MTTRALQIHKHVTLCVVLFMLGGCTENASKLRTDLDRLSGDMTRVRAFQAEQSTAIEDLRSDVRTLSGRLEELEHSQDFRGRDLSQLKQDLTSLRQRVPPPSMVPAEALEEDEAAAQSSSSDAAKFLSDGLTQIRQGRFNEALPFLQQAAQAPDDKGLYPNVLFWIGVVNEATGRENDAQAAYFKLTQTYPKNPRTPAALLRQGGIFIKANDKKAAKITLKKLVSDFPNSAEAATARDKLKKL